VGKLNDHLKQEMAAGYKQTNKPERVVGKFKDNIAKFKIHTEVYMMECVVCSINRE